MSRRPLRIHIEELVLHGVDPRDRHAIGDAVQQEIRTALAEQPMRAPDARAVERVDAGSLRSNPRMRGVGTQIAARLKGALRS
ncbi:MAG: hypothetical protein M3Q69_00695 [Acidobacteriota bacterium]|nr:hypothetical protein [Acidobacteriota bacterium]